MTPPLLGSMPAPPAAPVDGWTSAGVAEFAQSYASTCCAAMDLEIDVLRVERDALLRQVRELSARSQ